MRTLRASPIVPASLALVCALASSPVHAAEATTLQLMNVALESLATEEQVVVPNELRRRTGELIGFATGIDPGPRANAVIVLALMDRGDLITPNGFVPPLQSPVPDRVAAAFARCKARGDCGSAVEVLREQGSEVAKPGRKPKKAGKIKRRKDGTVVPIKGARLTMPLAVALLSLLPQQGFAAWADSIPTADPGDRALIELAKRRHAALFGG